MAYPEIISGKYRFSVIVPLYNKEPYIEKALGSVLSQTFKDYEIIVVNDGSTDDSLSVAQGVLEGVGNVRIINQQNSGVSTARNNGIAAANGDYICFLDADDWWEPTFLEEMDGLIKKYPGAGLYCTNYYYVHKRKSVVKLDIPTGYFNYCKEYARTLCMLATSSCCSNRSVLTEMGGFNHKLKLGEDFDLWIRIALKYGTAILNKPLVYFNNDVPVKLRATHHLHRPENHMLWNLGYLEEEEKTNPDYKQLIDNLRTYGLMPYFLSKEYHEAAEVELTKVDWSKQPKSIQKKYLRPLWFLRGQSKFMTYGSKAKQFLIRIIH